MVILEQYLGGSKTYCSPEENAQICTMKTLCNEAIKGIELHIDLVKKYSD